VQGLKDELSQAQEKTRDMAGEFYGYVLENGPTTEELPLGSIASKHKGIMKHQVSE